MEADEYAGNFDAYRPDITVLTSAEWDHPDVFADEAAVARAFEAWLDSPPDEAVIVANAADPRVEAVLESLERRREWRRAQSRSCATAWYDGERRGSSPRTWTWSAA